jgi:hypothetical protein
MPALIANYQKQVTVTQLKKGVAMVSQAVSLSSVHEDTDYQVGQATCGNITPQIFADTYVKPYFKTLQICTEPGDYCGYKSNRYKNLDGVTNDQSGQTFGNGQVVLAKMTDGSTMMFVIKYGGVNCTDDVYIDINGAKEPNLIGKDVFSFGYRGTGLVYGKGSGTCTKSTSLRCAHKIMEDGWEIKEDYPW